MAGYTITWEQNNGSRHSMECPTIERAEIAERKLLASDNVQWVHRYHGEDLAYTNGTPTNH